MAAPDMLPMSDLVSRSLEARRFSTVLMGLFAGLALVLTGIGIYGVVAYSVTRRVREIGVRMALGARSAGVVGLVVRQGMAPVLIGLAVGLGAALALGHLVAGMLYGVSTRDPASLAGVAAMLVVLALVAAYLPARRAARGDPLSALRGE